MYHFYVGRQGKNNKTFCGKLVCTTLTRRDWESVTCENCLNKKKPKVRKKKTCHASVDFNKLGEFLKTQKPIVHIATFDEQIKSITERLKKAGRRWKTLRSYIKDTSTGKILRFWVDPVERDEPHVNYGWYNIEDLVLWSDNKGRILKKIGVL